MAMDVYGRLKLETFRKTMLWRRKCQANVGHDLEDSLSFLVRYFVSFIHVDIGAVVTDYLTGW
jgi:hypothetical protein